MVKKEKTIDSNVVTIEDTVTSILFSKKIKILYRIFYYVIKKYSFITIYELTKIITKYNVNSTKLYSLFDTSVLENIINEGYTYSSGAIFIVSKKTILKHPKEFYENIYKTLQDIHPSAGYGLEKLWRIIFEIIN
jgi:hypothetical protein